MRSYWFKVGPGFNNGCLCKKTRGKFEYRDTEHTYTVEGQVMMEAEIEVTQLQSKQYQGLLAISRSWEGGLEQTLSEYLSGTDSVTP